MCVCLLTEIVWSKQPIKNKNLTPFIPMLLHAIYESLLTSQVHWSGFEFLYVIQVPPKTIHRAKAEHALLLCMLVAFVTKSLSCNKSTGRSTIWARPAPYTGSRIMIRASFALGCIVGYRIVASTP